VIFILLHIVKNCNIIGETFKIAIRDGPFWQKIANGDGPSWQKIAKKVRP